MVHVKPAIKEEELFIQTAIFLADECEVELKFSHPQVMNFVGDEEKCIECVEKLASQFPNRVAG
jgi:hypothetical protein